MRIQIVAVVLLLAGTPPITSLAAPPPKVELEIEVESEGAPRGGLTPLDVFAHIASGWHINAHEPAQPYLIPTELTVTLPLGVEKEEVYYPPPDKRKFAFAGDEQLLVYEGKLGLATAVRIPRDFFGTQLRIEAALRYQACNDTTCLPPTMARAKLDVPVLAAVAGVEEVEEEVGGQGAATDGGAGARQALFERWLVEQGLVFTLFAVALLGLGLNLTPCVYPLISVTVAYFGSEVSERSRVVLLSSLYVLGIALSFSALGLAAALSGGVFGAALQNPLVVLFIAGVMVVLAFGSFGLYQLQPPAALMRWAGGATSGAFGALFMGLTMGVVAAPCVGPIVLGLLLFVGSRQDPYLGFALFFMLALGMGAPYLALAMAAGSIKRLPRSGEWLVWTERLFGCVLLSLAAYFVAPLLPAPFYEWLLPSVIGLAGLYLGFIETAGQSVRYFPVLKGTVGVLMMAFAVWLGRPVAVDQVIAWEPVEVWSENGHDGTVSKPVVIDFAADWCIPCREMDHSTYVDPDVVREADRFRMIKADITEENEKTTKIVSEYDVRGVPTVIVFSSAGEEQHRFVGYVGPDKLVAAMRSAQ